MRHLINRLYRRRPPCIMGVQASASMFALSCGSLTGDPDAGLKVGMMLSPNMFEIRRKNYLVVFPAAHICVRKSRLALVRIHSRFVAVIC